MGKKGRGERASREGVTSVNNEVETRSRDCIRPIRVENDPCLDQTGNHSLMDTLYGHSEPLISGEPDPDEIERRFEMRDAHMHPDPLSWSSAGVVVVNSKTGMSVTIKRRIGWWGHERVRRRCFIRASDRAEKASSDGVVPACRAYSCSQRRCDEERSSALFAGDRYDVTSQRLDECQRGWWWP
jgi:hypothetical protein